MNEIELLAAVAALTGLMWVPYVLERIYRQGLVATVGYRNSGPTISAWADRAQKAHRNATENLVVFGVLSLAVQLAGVASDVTLLATQCYVVARVAHYGCYLFAIPWLRTAAFFMGFGAQLVLAYSLLS